MEKIKVEHVNYSYRNQYQTTQVLYDVSCTFEAGTFYAITGESGSGKSTLLSLLAGLDVPQDGQILIDGKSLAEKNRDLYRRDEASVVYQAFHLFPLLTALENVMYPLELKGIPRKQAREQAIECLKRAGLPEKIQKQFPRMMSGEEQQRVAIARAIAAGGTILLADEPTGNLDSENEEKITELLAHLAWDNGYTVIVVTHNPGVAKKADVILTMRDGKIRVSDEMGGKGNVYVQK